MHTPEAKPTSEPTFEATADPLTEELIRLLQVAVSFQGDPSRRLELCHLRHDRGRLADKLVLSVSSAQAKMHCADASRRQSKLALLQPAHLFLYRFSATGYGGAMFLVGGFSPFDKIHYPDVRIIDPWSTTYTELPLMPMGRRAAGVTVMHGCLFVIGGKGTDGHGANVYKLPLRDPILAWIVMNPMPVGREECAAVVLHDTLFIIGGFTSQGRTTEILRYDASEDSWAIVAHLSEGRYGCSVAADGTGGAYIVGGFGERGGSEHMDMVEYFDGRTFKRTSCPKLPRPIWRPGLIVRDGVLHVWGGFHPHTVTRHWLQFVRADRPEEGVWEDTEDRLSPSDSFLATAFV